MGLTQIRQKLHSDGKKHHLLREAFPQKNCAKKRPQLMTMADEKDFVTALKKLHAIF